MTKLRDKLNNERFHIPKSPSGFRKYWWIAVLVISLGGLYYPLLGWAVPVFMIFLLGISYFNGRYWCGNLCPRGSFNDRIVSKVSRYKKIPELLKKNWFRLLIVGIFIGLFSFRFLNTYSSSSGLALFYKLGFIFATICLITTIIALMVGSIYSPRAWCTFCPMGTLQSYIYKFGGKNER